MVIGSSNTDMTVLTQRHPKPGETVLGGQFRMGAGGKGANQAVAAKRLGGDVAFVCKVGNDLFGDNAIHHYEEEPQGVVVRYDREIEDKLQRTEDELRKNYADLTNLRWHAIKMLENDKEVMKDHPVDLSSIVTKSYEKEIINEKVFWYRWSKRCS